MPFKVGTILNKRYRVKNKLGRGGQGEVYLVEDRNVYNQKKAVKQLLNLSDLTASEQKAALEMFEKEGAFLAMLNHPGLPNISDKFNLRGKCFLVIDFVEGDNLEKLIKEKPSFFTELKVIEIALALCDILHYMHTQNPPIVFRDLKPENIIMARDGTVKLIDFGTARFFDKRKKTDTIQIGTVGYAAPEQYSGQTDPRADIYAFGALLHHLLTGLDPKHLNPFEAEGIAVRSIKPGLSKDIEAIIAHALQSNRKKRYDSVSDMKFDLLRCPTIQVCGTCGAIFASAARFCSHCGCKVGKAAKTKENGKGRARFTLEPKQGSGLTPIRLEKEVTQVGRSRINDVVLSDSTVSKTHALLKLEGGSLTVVDLNSTNGTFVNGRKVTACQLKDGWELQLGRTVLKVRGK